MNIFDYIQKYAEAHGIADYSVKSRIITLDQFATVQHFAPGVAFFHKLIITGDINDVKDLKNKLLTADTVSDFYDFAKIATVSDMGTLQKAESDFIFDCDNMLTLDLHQGEGAVFQEIYSAQLQYIYFMQKPATAANAVKAGNVGSNMRKQPAADIYIN